MLNLPIPEAEIDIDDALNACARLETQLQLEERHQAEEHLASEPADPPSAFRQWLAQMESSAPSADKPLP